MSGTDFKKLQIKQLPAIKGELTTEARYWRTYKNTHEDKLGSAITNINFQNTEPYDFCVTSGTKVALYSGQTKKKLRLYSRFSETAYGGMLRNDGLLLAAGTEKGIIKIFDVNKKLLLRQMKGHTDAVHVVCFPDTSSSLLSGSDDKTLRLWDITTGKSVAILRGHTDYVRSLCPYKNAPSLFVSGSYDHQVKLWDSRDNYSCIHTIPHSESIEYVYTHADSKYVYSAAGNSVYVWDLFNLEQPISVLTKHVQPVTSISYYNNMLLSTSLDGYIKVYDTTTYTYKHEIKMGTPLLASAVSPDGSCIVAGSTEGLLYIQEKQNEPEPIQPVTNYRGNTRLYYNRGEHAGPDMNAIVMAKRPKVKLTAWDKYLKEFKYHKALDAAMKSKQPSVIISVLEELRQRNGLYIALGGRESDDLENILSFFLKYVCYPVYSLPICDCIAIVMDIYSPEGGRSNVLDDFISKLYTVLHQEVQLEEEVMSVLGIMDSLYQ